ncbi:MAG TPA: aldehyde dehydrogenase family protein [Dyella sp.]|uniref:L-piperidine-6-carboxylate dehydrogenase n=1 Tax=Dyella sp. TaxID=1869338 RepID=UPI002D78C1D1|nr:aldehyde dehydrogenase family protein [Dyella sp.]HET6553631.1 aldehyde dehydrogenase family protein [Dyella sp.]
MKYATFLAQAGIDASALSSGSLEARTPVDGSLLGKVQTDDAASVETRIRAAAAAFLVWRSVPGPRRGALVSAFAQRVREQKPALAALVSLESGKILTEGAGEVQEVIDICDFAVGLSRQLHGLTIASERPGHHLLERWQPLGPVAVITAFNFPMAVWAWNAMLALVCGDSVIWKPSEKTPLCAMALHRLLEDVLKDFPDAPAGLSALVQGGRELGEQLVDSPAIALLSATGSTAMGRAVGPRVAARFGRTLLELGGNNAAIIGPTADLQLALRAIVFSAVGTAGQRCTTLRRLLVHRSIHDRLVASLKQSYAKLPIGSPLDAGTLVGPLIDRASFDRMQQALARARKEGARVTGGERVQRPGMDQGFYVQPALVEMDRQLDVALEETFAPILYVMPYDSFDEAIALQNAAKHGLSSAIFTNDMREAESFVSVAGSDCGIANVNTGTSGAEIGGAFGGEKETGGGRESGSDAWKNYMRRQTQTINYSTALPLAQGVSFDV